MLFAQTSLVASHSPKRNNHFQNWHDIRVSKNCELESPKTNSYHGRPPNTLDPELGRRLPLSQPPFLCDPDRRCAGTGSWIAISRLGCLRLGGGKTIIGVVRIESVDDEDGCSESGGLGARVDAGF